MFVVGNGSARSKALFHQITDHKKSVSGAYISPDGSCLVSVSLDDTMRLWSGNFSNATSIQMCEVKRRNNQTGRWLSTLRPVFDLKTERSFIVGSMDQPRRVEAFDINEKAGAYSFRQAALLAGDMVGSVCSRNAVHPTRSLVAGSNSSGRVHFFEKTK